MLFCFLVLLPALINGLKSLHSGAPTRDTLSIGSIGIQPSEFLKIGVAIFFAAYLNDNLDVIAQGYYRLGFLRLPPLRQLGPLIFILALSLGSFLIIRELGLAMLIYGLFLCLTYIATNKVSYVVVSLGAFVVLAFVGYAILPYVRDRFATVVFNPLVGTNTIAYDNFVEVRVHKSFKDCSIWQVVESLVGARTGRTLVYKLPSTRIWWSHLMAKSWD